MLTKDAILKSDDITLKEFDVPEWGGNIMVAVMSGAARDAYEEYREKLPHDDKGKLIATRGLREFAIMHCVTDSKGVRIFADTDHAALTKKSSVVIDKVFDFVDEVNNITGTQIEEVEKNSEGELSDSSGSSSPTNTESPSDNSSNR